MQLAFPHKVTSPRSHPASMHLFISIMYHSYATVLLKGKNKTDEAYSSQQLMDNFHGSPSFPICAYIGLCWCVTGAQVWRWIRPLPFVRTLAASTPCGSGHKRFFLLHHSPTSSVVFFLDEIVGKKKENDETLNRKRQSIKEKRFCWKATLVSGEPIRRRVRLE